MNKGSSRRPEAILSKESTAMGGRTEELWLRYNRYCLHSQIRLGKQGQWTLLANSWLTGAYWTPTHLFHWILAYGGAHRSMNSHRHSNSVTAPVSAVVEVVAHLSACATGICITTIHQMRFGFYGYSYTWRKIICFVFSCSSYVSLSAYGTLESV